MDASKAKLASLALGAAMISAAAQGATLKVVNQSNSYITVSVDGAYGCNTAGHTTCTIPVAPGVHVLRAATASGQAISTRAEFRSAGATRTWVISSANRR